MRSGSRLLLGDDLVLDGAIGVLGNDLLVHEFVLGLVRTALDDRLSPSRANLHISAILAKPGAVRLACSGFGRGRAGMKWRAAPGRRAWRRGSSRTTLQASGRFSSGPKTHPDSRGPCRCGYRR